MKPQLSLQGAVRCRSRGNHTFELRVPDFTLAPGDFVAVAGASGCGKSTLLDLLALVLPPDSTRHFSFHLGDSSVDLQNLWNTGDEAALAAIRRRHLGYVLQTGGLFPFLSVRHNIRLALDLNGAADDGRVDALAETIGLSAPMLASKPQFLSGGQRQRAAILRALAHRPRVVLADEPTAAVDQELAHRIVRELRRLAAVEGSTVIMVTHDRTLVDENDVQYGFDLHAEENRTVSTCKRH